MKTQDIPALFFALLAICMTANAEDLNWPHYGNDLGQSRFIENDSINLSNVEKLRLKWIFQTGMAGSFANTPIVEDGVMYVSTPYNHVFAVDLSTGREIWRHRYSLGLTIFCCGPNNRGLAINEDSVFMATLDAKLIALNKKTGQLQWRQILADPEYGYSGTEAPLVYGNKVITGIAGAEYGIRGFITAHDVKTGQLLWKWYTIPEPDEPQPDDTTGWFGTFEEKADGINPLNRDIEFEKQQIADNAYPDAWKTGGGSAWTTKSLDAERGLVYAMVGNPAPDLDGSVRPGDNRWTNSLVALDFETGKLVWGYQYIPHDVWDLDSTSPPILTQAKNNDGNMIDVVVHGGKTGWAYIHNRDTGELIRRSEAMVEQRNLFALPTKGIGTEMLPGANGGVNWSPGSVNPSRQHVYYANLHQPMHYELRSVPWRKGRLWLGGSFKGIPGEEESGNISAVDLNTGKLVWQFLTEEPMIGGTLTTSGDLVFTGGDEGYFIALNAITGEKVWEFQTGAGVNAAPMGFVYKGKLHIAVAAGGNAQINTSRGGSILVFTVD